MSIHKKIISLTLFLAILSLNWSLVASACVAGDASKPMPCCQAADAREWAQASYLAQTSCLCQGVAPPYRDAQVAVLPESSKHKDRTVVRAEVIQPPQMLSGFNPSGAIPSPDHSSENFAFSDVKLYDLVGVYLI